MTPDEKRALDVAVAEKWMGWQRMTLDEKEIDFEALIKGKMPLYRVVGQAEYLIPPTRDLAVSPDVGIREQLGDLRIGGELPHYTDEDAQALEVAKAIGDTGRVVFIKIDGLRGSGVERYTVLIDKVEKRWDDHSLALAICRMAKEA